MCSTSLVLISALLVVAPRDNAIEHQRDIPLDDGYVRDVAFSPKGKLVAGCGDRLVQLFDLKTGRRLHRLRGHAKPVLSVAFTPNGRLLASSSGDGTVRLWDVKTGQTIKALVGRTRYSIGCLAISPDGKTLISCGMPPRRARNIDNHDVYLWNLSTRKWEHFHQRGNQLTDDEKPVRRVAFSPDGKQVAMAEVVGNVRLYDLNYGLAKRFCRKHADLQEATWVAFSPDGRKLLSCGRDNTIRLWDVKSSRPLAKINGSNQGLDLQRAMQITDADRRRADADMKKCDRNQDGVIDPRERRPLAWRSADFVRAYSNGDRNISRAEAIRRWARLRRDRLAATKCFQAAAFLPDGARIISVTRDERIQIWYAASRKVLGSARGSDKAVAALALSRDGKLLATCGGKKSIRLWKIGE